MFNREVGGIVASLLSLKQNPIIRYHSNSEVARIIAEDIKRTIEQENNLGDLFRFQYNNPPILLIFDRKEDPITPLLLQWTYQVMYSIIIGYDTRTSRDKQQ